MAEAGRSYPGRRIVVAPTPRAFACRGAIARALGANLFRRADGLESPGVESSWPLFNEPPRSISLCRSSLRFVFQAMAGRHELQSKLLHLETCRVSASDGSNRSRLLLLRNSG